MTEIEQEAVVPPAAMTSIGHLIDWLNASGREFLVFKSEDLVRSFPDSDEGVAFIQQVVGSYRAFRNKQPAYEERGARLDQGRISKRAAMELGWDASVVGSQTLPEAIVFKTDALEPDELDALIEWAGRRKSAILKERESRQIERAL
jgi:hypothetical protein